MDDDLESDATAPVDVPTQAAELEDERFDVAEPWPQLSPLELAVCLADAAGRPAFMRGATTT